MTHPDEARKPAQTAQTRPSGRAPTAVFLALVCLLLLAWGLLGLPRARQAIRDEAIVKALTLARRLALEAESIKRKTGEYPQTGAYESIVGPGGGPLVYELDEALGAVSPSAGAMHMPYGGGPPTAGGAGEDTDQVLFTMGHGRLGLAILPGGLVRVTPALAPSERLRSEWLRIAESDAPDAADPGGGGDE